MKQKRKISLSPLQQKRLLRISLCILVATMLWVVFAPGRGLYFLHQQKKYLAQITAEQEALFLNNQDLKKEVERLQNDDVYLEEVARERYNMLKENEMIFDFSKEKDEK